ncbi:hypothetical protein F5Y15DRAFT_414965 [Xylariaceae sp. FL0016]|nr:hypothetical protein F5Y15DRAFT_414965 [Xylariaceae sp. FL0016]
MADQATNPAVQPAPVRESIEAKRLAEDAMDIDTHEPSHTVTGAHSIHKEENKIQEAGETPAESDAPGEAEAEAEADADADADADDEPEESQAPERLDNEMLNVIENIANYLTAYKEPDGYHIATHFQRIPNRRLIPDYHEVIKEPTALSTIRTKKLKKQYAAFSEFVRDVALIAHNAQVYNRPSSQVFKDAIRLREVFKEELQKLVDDETIAAEEAILPDLGEIPEAEDESQDEEEDEEEEDEDEEDEDEDDEDDDSDDESDRRRSRRGRGGRRSDIKNEGLQKKHGRPPSVLTPAEARIQNLLNGLRKLKHPGGDLLIYPFEKLPSRPAHSDYYDTIKSPMALDMIKKKFKRKKYQNMNQAMVDIDLMFDNAKAYNEESSQIYKDAVELRRNAHELSEQEKAKPDEAFADEDGRLPLAGISHNGEVWKVGDWVHITNMNDPAKPIVAQLYRTWQDSQGQKWVNACWYYRPEQTVHRFDKHFLENEVVKTGQYRDHRIDEVVDRCFVMFVTRYNRGRPRGLPKDKEVYVCESRYNEEQHKLNKIKTWASCLPDEVRDKDYEMDLFDAPHRLKKMPSPIKHLLQNDAKPTDPLPKPTYSYKNAPPVIGAVHCRARERGESPPPQPTPPPAVEPVRRPSMMQTAHAPNGTPDVAMGGTSHFHSIPAPPTPSTSHVGAYAPHFAPRPSPTPVPVPQYGTHTFQAQGAHATPQMPQTPHYQPHPQQQVQHQHQHQHHAPAYNGYPSQYQAPVPMAHQPHHAPPPMTQPLGYDPSQRMVPSPVRNTTVPVPSPSVHPQVNAYNPPRPVEVYKLDDAMNAKIPEEIRSQFLQDETSSVLFFTKPPLDRPHLGISKEHAHLGHSIRYLADRAREIEDRRAKRKARDEAREEEDNKRRALEQEAAEKQKQDKIGAAAEVFAGWVQGIQRETEKLDTVYGGWSVKDKDIDAVQQQQGQKQQ